MSSLPESVFSPASLSDLVPLPRAAALLLWTSAYLRGDIGPDDAQDIAFGTGHRQSSLPGQDVYDWMTSLRRLPLVQAQLVLPRPGRIAGLTGPPEAMAAALDAEQAVVVSAAGLAQHTLVPEISGGHGDGSRRVDVRWRLIPGTGQSIMPRPTSGSARADFLEVLRRAADSAVHIDLVPDEPVPEASLPPSWTAVGMPRHLAGPQRHLLALSARTLLLTLSALAEDDDRPSAQAQARTVLLQEIEDAARAALVDIVTASMEESLS